jgi:tRNA(fMet)-specific endonuclease VapC
MACLDTTFLIDLAGSKGRGYRRRAEAKLRALQDADEPLTTTRFNVAELWVGVARSSAPEVEGAAVEALVESFLVLEFDSRAARVFGSIAASAHGRGRPVGDMDALIASVALCHGQKLVTRNERHFNEIPGLVVETY